MRAKAVVEVTCLLCLMLSGVSKGARIYLHADSEMPAAVAALRGPVALAALPNNAHAAGARRQGPSPTVQTVFLIRMENQNLSSFNTSDAPYIMGTLIPSGASALQYYNPPASHPSEPNYVWLEAGDNEGLTTDADPAAWSSSSTTAHLSTYLTQSGISWRGYGENITGTDCPLNSNSNSLDSTNTQANYYARHLPFLFFQDLTNGESSSSAACIANIRPYSQLASDLANGTVARYNYIAPNGTDDMHDSDIATGDEWLSQNLPAILNSSAFRNNGVIFITWDEAVGSDGPIPMIVLSPLAKSNYTNSIHYDHSSLVLTLQEIFGVGPCLRNACSATDLSDLFQPGAIPPLQSIFVSLNPQSGTLQANQQQQFTATVSGTVNVAVDWTISPPGLGTINAGLYTAPGSISSAQTVEVIATSEADETKSATVTLTLEPQQIAQSPAPSPAPASPAPAEPAQGTQGTPSLASPPAAPPAPSAPSPSPAPNGYAYQGTITVSHAQVANSDQVNFPVLISGTYSALANTSYGGEVTNPNGYDIVFTSDPSGFNVLNFERESYSPSTGQAVFWVELPVLSHTADTVFYIFCGNVAVTSDPSKASATWDSNYLGVWHLPNGSFLSANDSTANGTNGTINASLAVAGQIDGAASFDGVSSFINFGNNLSVLEPAASLTVSAWVKPSSSYQNNYANIVDYDYSTPRGSPYVSYKLSPNDVNSVANTYEFELSTTHNWDNSVTSGVTPSAGTWAYLAGTYDGETQRIYVNGQLRGEAPVTGNILYANGNFVLGANGSLDQELWNGVTDEVRASSAARSADWIATEYNNQSNPSAFYSISW